MSKSTFKGWRLCINCTEKGQKANLNQKGGQSLRVRNCLTIQFHVTDMINRIWKNNIFKYLLVSVTESANLQKWNSGETEYFSCQRCFLFLSWGVTGNTKGWQENLQWLAPFDTGIASYVPYSAKLLCTTSSFFTRCQHISSFDEWPSRSTVTILNLNYSSGPFLWVCLPMPFLCNLWGYVLWSLEGTSALA